MNNWSQNMLESFQCGICYNQYQLKGKRMPLILSECGHTNCRDCITKSISNFRDDDLNQVVNIQCSVCKVKTISKLKDLKKNFALTQGLQENNIQFKNQKEFCFIHQNQIAKVFCNKTKNLLCQECSEKQQDNNLTANRPENIGIRRSLREKKPTPRDNKKYVYEQIRTQIDNQVMNQEEIQERNNNFIQVEVALAELDQEIERTKDPLKIEIQKREGSLAKLNNCKTELQKGLENIGEFYGQIQEDIINMVKEMIKEQVEGIKKEFGKVSSEIKDLKRGIEQDISSKTSILRKLIADTRKIILSANKNDIFENFYGNGQNEVRRQIKDIENKYQNFVEDYLRDSEFTNQIKLINDLVTKNCQRIGCANMKDIKENMQSHISQIFQQRYKIIKDNLNKDVSQIQTKNIDLLNQIQTQQVQTHARLETTQYVNKRDLKYQQKNSRNERQYLQSEQIVAVSSLQIQSQNEDNDTQITHEKPKQKALTRRNESISTSQPTKRRNVGRGNCMNDDDQEEIKEEPILKSIVQSQEGSIQEIPIASFLQGSMANQHTRIQTQETSSPMTRLHHQRQSLNNGQRNFLKQEKKMFTQTKSPISMNIGSDQRSRVASPIRIRAKEESKNKQKKRNPLSVDSTPFKTPRRTGESKMDLVTTQGVFQFDIDINVWIPNNQENPNQVQFTELIEGSAICNLDERFQNCLLFTGENKSAFLVDFDPYSQKLKINKLNLQLKVARYHHQIIFNDNKLFFLGGKNKEGEMLNSCEVVQIDSKLTKKEFLKKKIASTSIQNMNYKRSNFSALANTKNEIYVFGGEQLNQSYFEIYNLLYQNWESHKMNMNLNFMRSECALLTRKSDVEQIIILSQPYEDQEQTNILQILTFKKKSFTFELKERGRTLKLRNIQGNVELNDNHIIILGGSKGIDGEFIDLNEQNGQFIPLPMNNDAQVSDSYTLLGVF